LAENEKETENQRGRGQIIR